MGEKQVNFHPVQSSNIHSVAYDPTTSTLEVKFHGGGHFRYHDVPPGVHEAFLKAPSAGKFFATHIRGQLRGENVKAPKA